MRACNDEALKQNLTMTRWNATYILPASQNQLIDAITAVIRRHVVAEVNNAGYFSILADETSYFSQKEQLAVCIRYEKDCAIFERFLCFELAPDLTGDGLAAQLLSVLDAVGLDKDCLIGQGCDGAAAMSGQQNGVQKHVRDQCPATIYVHCSSHALSLVSRQSVRQPRNRCSRLLVSH